MNVVTLIGRLTRDNDLRYSPNGTAVLRNTIAVNRIFKNQIGEREADFINIVAFGKTAELIANHIGKGEQLGIEGRIQTGSYEKDGRTVYTTDVVVNNITFIASKGKSTQTGNKGVSPENKPSDNPFTEPLEVDDSDLPF